MVFPSHRVSLGGSHLMLHGLYVSGLAAVGQSVKLDVIANNLANVNTPGFRRDSLSFQERLVEALEDKPDLQYYNLLVDRYGGAPFIDDVSWDQNSGSFEQTDRDFDFAIVGEGFFGVKDLQTDKVYYTRSGNFTLDGNGRVVTQNGKYQLLNQDGAGVNMDPSAGLTDLRVDEEGQFFQGDALLHQFMVRDFSDKDNLRKHGHNLYQYTGSETGVSQGYRVVQGALESSTVNTISEMVEMIKATRAVESNLQMVTMQDGTLDRLINGFGRPS